MAAPQLEPGWLEILSAEFEQEYMSKLRHFIQQEKEQGNIIYPASSNTFYALNATPFDTVKIVILGQDPYHGPDQAHGLSFSVPDGIKLPPSLRNIFKELHADLGFTTGTNGDLTAWANQGVLLLNSVLSVSASKAASHARQGWEQFTDKIIYYLNLCHTRLVFILWGSYAQKKGHFIDPNKHLILKSVHPSPLSSHRGFFGSKPFSQANKYLVQQGKKQIDWSI
jgi:uracil-DNA glycosylase